MLLSLSIQNFTIVAHLELDFKPGMSAFTGETGAGKSIMIDALMLALGERADVSVIRTGSAQCEIHALFSIDIDSEPYRWLQAHDLLSHETEVWLRRVILVEGRSKSYINGQPLPLNKIKEFSELLVDIHGQHQHQRLLHPNTHRKQLDDFAQHHDLMQRVSEQHQACQTLLNKQQQLEQLGTNRERAELLRYQIEELEALQLVDDEMHALHQEHQLLHHAKDYLEHLEHLQQAFGGNSEHRGICQQLHNMTHTLLHLPQTNTRIHNCQELVNNALILCEEALSEIEHFAGDIQLDPERLAAVETRMSRIHQTARKYHLEPNQLLAHLTQLKSEQFQLEHAATEKQRCAAEYQTQRAEYTKSALALRSSRQAQATLLEQEITSTIRQLGMPQGVVTIQITPLEMPHAHGLDKVEYIVCTNPGIAPDSLSKIASGGELSRISLSIQLITARRKSATPTLIFDEVDVGIGGATAALVGQLLRQLGHHLQVFCVTHQPQVASAAHHHFLVEKTIHDQTTFSSIRVLNSDEKIEEIARMLGGLSINTETRTHAKAMLLEWA